MVYWLTLLRNLCMQLMLGLGVSSTLLTNCPEIQVPDTFMSLIFSRQTLPKKKKSFLENQFTRGLLISKLHPEFQKCSRHYTALGNTLLLTLVRLEALLNVKEAQYLLRQHFSHDCQMWLLSTDDSQSRELASQDFWKIQPKTVTCF